MAFAVEQFLIGLAVGAAAVLGGRAAVRYVREKGSARLGTPDPPAGVFSETSARPSSGGEGRSSPSGSASPSGPGSEVQTSTDPALLLRVPIESDAVRAPVEQVRLSRRILLHLFELGRVGPDGIGRPEATQRGIGTALGAEQSALSKVLRRLTAGGAIEVTRRHVFGGDRRIKVYSLTLRGESLAREFWLAQSPRPRRIPPERPTVPTGPRDDFRDGAFNVSVR